MSVVEWELVGGAHDGERIAARRCTLPAGSRWADVLEAAGWWWWRQVPGSLRRGQGWAAADWEPWEPVDAWCRPGAAGAVETLVFYRRHVPAEPAAQ